MILISASCDFPRPHRVGGDDASSGAGTSDAGGLDGTGDMPGSPTCQLTAMEPSLANSGDIVTLEGTFDGTVTVTFPGSPPVSATTLGAHRATAIVPASATDGNVSVTACGSTFGSLPFLHTQFTIDLGAFGTEYDQAVAARQYAALTAARSGHSSIVVKSHLYILGGTDGRSALDSVEQASINADGSLGPFANVSGVTLTTARYHHSSILLGNYLYVIGGLGDVPLTSIERAIIEVDGSIGPFTSVPGVALTTARQGHTNAVIGNYLYVLGGFGSTSLNSVERAIINPDGSLGAFEAISDVTMTTSRHGHTNAVLKDYLYIFGGMRGNTFLQDVERAAIHGDGSLGSFESVSSALKTARSDHTTEALGNYVYVFGGNNNGISLNSIERAPLDSGGSLGTFVSMPSTKLTTPRRDQSTALIGSNLYVFGGTSDVTLNTVEHTSLNASGMLGSFQTVPGLQVGSYIGMSSHTNVVIGSFVYLLAGSTGIEAAPINIDGSLGPFTHSTSQLTTARTSSTAAVVGNSLYVLGGQVFSGLTYVATDNIERAAINADGSLGVFTTVSRVLATPRYGHTTAVIGNNLYVLGGHSGTYLDTVERAAINPDGSLGPFAVVDSVTFANARGNHASVMIRGYLYLVGGTNGTPMNAVERATIAADGSLGTFALVPGITLVSPRSGHTATVIGNALHILGGGYMNGPGPPFFLDTDEVAPVASDGSLGAFSIVSGPTAGPREAHSSTVIGNYLYVFGGHDYYGTLNDVRRALPTSGAL